MIMCKDSDARRQSWFFRALVLAGFVVSGCGLVADAAFF
jgi:hypothetical protein